MGSYPKQKYLKWIMQTWKCETTNTGCKKEGRSMILLCFINVPEKLSLLLELLTPQSHACTHLGHTEQYLCIPWGMKIQAKQTEEKVMEEKRIEE